MTPQQLRLIPSALLYRYRGAAALEDFLTEHHLPRPTLAELDAERKRRQRGGKAGRQ